MSWTPPIFTLPLPNTNTAYVGFIPAGGTLSATVRDLAIVVNNGGTNLSGTVQWGTNTLSDGSVGTVYVYQPTAGASVTNLSTVCILGWQGVGNADQVLAQAGTGASNGVATYLQVEAAGGTNATEVVLSGIALNSGTNSIQIQSGAFGTGVSYVRLPITALNGTNVVGAGIITAQDSPLAGFFTIDGTWNIPANAAYVVMGAAVSQLRSPEIIVG